MEHEVEGKPQASPAQQPPKAATASGRYSACLYVHGMGSQRRFAETCRLIDRLDANVSAELGPDKMPLRMFSRVESRVEPSRNPDDPDIAYIRAYLVEGSDKNAQWTPARFYELYWAPVMAGQGSVSGVFTWMMRQVIRPVFTLTAPWRERARLRRAALAAMFDRPQLPAGSVEGDYAKLMRYYDKYENLAVQRDLGASDFVGFLALIKDENEGKPEAGVRLCELARTWRKRYVMTELRNFAVLVTIALAVALIGIAGVWLASVLLREAALLVTSAHLPSLAAFLPKQGDELKAAMALFVSASLAIGLGRFLTQYMGDVQAWATFEETDEKFERRAKVIATGQRILRHILEDESCERVAIVSHSLGTSIAQDVLFALARHNKARNKSGDPIVGPVPLDKIEHFVTLGSPIDKIEYFFESAISPSHRYKRHTDEMRGDIGTVPFSRGKVPHIHWINFWDDGDLVSGALQSPANRAGTWQKVDNVHVQCLRFPAPGRSHSAYFDDRRVLDYLTDIIFTRKYSFEALEPDLTAKGRDRAPKYDEVRIASLDRTGNRAAWQILALAIPWLALGALIAQLSDPAAATAWIAVAGSACGVLTLGALLNWKQGVRFPIEARHPVKA